MYICEWVYHEFPKTFIFQRTKDSENIVKFKLSANESSLIHISEFMVVTADVCYELCK